MQTPSPPALPAFADILQAHPGWLDEAVPTAEASRITGEPVPTLETKRVRGGGPVLNIWLRGAVLARPIPAKQPLDAGLPHFQSERPRPGYGRGRS